jgi:hypothetical protein
MAPAGTSKPDKHFIGVSVHCFQIRFAPSDTGTRMRHEQLVITPVIMRLCGSDMYEEGLISLWLYKENNKVRDLKNVFTYSPLSSTHL